MLTLIYSIFSITKISFLWPLFSKTLNSPLFLQLIDIVSRSLENPNPETQQNRNVFFLHCQNQIRHRKG